MALRVRLAWFILLMLTASGCGFRMTDYTRPDIPELFDQLKVGDSLHAVYQTVRDPFTVVLVEFPSAPDQVDRSGRLPKVGLEEVIRIAGTTSGVLCLEYSRPKPKSELYCRYQVLIRQGKVVRIDKGVVID